MSIVETRVSDEKVGHAPGPWRVLEWANEKKGYIAIVGPGKPESHICDVFPFGKRAEHQTLAEHTANARLISAAPDMLAALDRALEIIGDNLADQRTGDGWKTEEIRDAWLAGQAAVAKARGR